ncbi:hypothetical protein [Undibacterium danionis]|uniref:DUF4149 domain-containing protein n=1 Tax=Undibacterium danionis TaxID=1812100 RepID=A0ABV6IJF5_9BURK
MTNTFNLYLISAAVLTSIAALLHFACILFGAPLYRLLGAGDVIAKMVEHGHVYPHVVAMLVGSALLVCAAYALSAAGVLMRLPLLTWVLCAVTAVFVLRGVAFPLLMPFFPGNSSIFWMVSSGLCLLIGTLHFIGLYQIWSRLV